MDSTEKIQHEKLKLSIRTRLIERGMEYVSQLETAYTKDAPERLELALQELEAEKFLARSIGKMGSPRVCRYDLACALTKFARKG
jgi:hypothetical protein